MRRLGTCTAGQTPAVDGCVQVVLLDAAGDPAAPGTEPAFARFEGIAGQFSTWAVALAAETDDVPPVVSVPGNIVVDATGPAGATVTYSASASDAVDPSPSLSCVPASGSVFPMGRTTVTCSATDDTGNSASAGFTVEVRGAAEQLPVLRGRTLAFLDSPRLRVAFTAPLDIAAAALASGRTRGACLALGAYNVLVRAAPRTAFTPAEKAELLADANRIRAVLGCT